jgi:hypothetical protein
MAEPSGVSAEASCLCGDNRWQVSGALREMGHCHCSMCRKLHGTAFATYAVTAPENFRWLSGEQNLCHFESSAGMDRPFCGRCGSTVPALSDAFPDEVSLPVGPLEGDFKERPLDHIFVASSAPWYDVPNDLPHYDLYEPGVQLPEVVQPAPASLPGKLCGSCLCDGIAYAIEGPLGGLVHCHCSRCRRARGRARQQRIHHAGEAPVVARRGAPPELPRARRPAIWSDLLRDLQFADAASRPGPRSRRGPRRLAR